MGAKRHIIESYTTRDDDWKRRRHAEVFGNDLSYYDDEIRFNTNERMLFNDYFDESTSTSTYKYAPFYWIKVVIIAHRFELLYAIFELYKGLDFDLYDKLPNCAHSERLIICINSLYKVNRHNQWDLVLIDETEQMLTAMCTLKKGRL